MKVDVYLNLNEECVSVRSRESEDYGRVVAHKQKVHVSDAEFVVQPSGREKCRESGVKNVHAFVRGEWTESEKVVYGERVTYNPFEYDTFVHKESEEPVESADLVMVTAAGNISANGLSRKV
jgi:hypothetical protein